ncbi:unnamed protein product, partial [marine sediment metagenome]
MLKLTGQLALNRCPHCSIANPLLKVVADFATSDHAGANRRLWFVYECATCGGAVLAGAKSDGGPVTEMHPPAREASGSIPERARHFLQQAIDTLHAPSGAVMLAASAVDAMLKERGYKEGSLNARIKRASEAHLITPEMEQWAHEVRLDANEQRHADEAASLPTSEDAKRTVRFA